MLRDELAGERGGNNNPDGCNQYKAVDGEVNNYNVIFDQDKPTQGNSKAYTASRLHKENPDLYKDVIDGKLSANAAAIKAGFRKKNISIPHDPQEAARALKRKYEKTEWDLLIAEIQLLND